MTILQIEHYRRPHPNGFEHFPGDPFGWFMIPSHLKERGKGKNKTLAVMVAPLNSKWQHVSVSGIYTPSWDEMCFVKDLIFEPDEVVVQYHPPRTSYVNIAQTCLHLWRLNDGVGFPLPPIELV